MTKAQFLTLLALRCENRTDSDFTTLANLEIALVQRNELEANAEFFPWFLESEWADASVTAGEERLPLPVDFIAEIEGQVMQLQIDGIWTDLRRGRYDELLREFPYETSGPPQAYDIVGKYIVVRPTPDKVYPIRMRCIQRDKAFDLLADTESNKFLLHASDWLLAAAGRVIAGLHLHNDALATKFSTLRDEAKTRVMLETESREHINRTYRMEG